MTTKTKDKPKKPNTVQKQGKYKFNDADKRTLSSQLAEECIRVGTLEAEKKEVMSEFKAKIDAAEARVREVSQKVISGHEYRDFECIIEKDIKEKTITYIDIDTDNVIESRKMDPHEYQLAITDKQKGEEKDEKEGDKK